ncbi:hypothetical protein EHS25_002155 [Saitozyma podzolica]|uniref:Uncharacterized protein n=1 Tax=Saitozyma podzolica TaxID=1890683 RepID=A0A427YF88_9TREE|nr:hypothetical protein EHS25_002155 [Saitozyma podzolica]
MQSEAQTKFLEDVRSEWEAAQTTEDATKVFSKLMDADVIDDVAYFLGLMHKSFGCSYSHWTGPGMKSLCSTKLVQISQGDNRQERLNLNEFMTDMSTNAISRLRALATLDKTLKPMWDPKGRWDTFLSGVQTTLSSDAIASRMQIEPDPETDTDSDDGL